MQKVLSEILIPMLDQIAMLTEQLGGFDERIEQMAESKYPETKVLRGVKGVGPLTAMSFVLTVGDPRRFSEKSRRGLLPGFASASLAVGRKGSAVGHHEGR